MNAIPQIGDIFDRVGESWWCEVVTGPDSQGLVAVLIHYPHGTSCRVVDFRYREEWVKRQQPPEPLHELWISLDGNVSARIHVYTDALGVDHADITRHEPTP